MDRRDKSQIDAGSEGVDAGDPIGYARRMTHPPIVIHGGKGEGRASGAASGIAERAFDPADAAEAATR